MRPHVHLRLASVLPPVPYLRRLHLAVPHENAFLPSTVIDLFDCPMIVSGYGEVVEEFPERVNEVLGYVQVVMIHFFRQQKETGTATTFTEGLRMRVSH